MDTTWIVAADAGRARIFAETDRNHPLQEVEDMISSAARMRVSDQLSDKMSPVSAGSSSHGTGGALPSNQYQPQQSPEEREAEMFAKSICGFLLKSYQDGKFQKLELIAEPKFLGVLRMNLDAQLKPQVSREINKDYSQFSGHQLREQMKALNAKR
jgi:protein required for attachment to host cells